MFASRTALRPADVAIRVAIVALALTTGYIHYTLGGLLFTLNALGYLTAAVASGFGISPSASTRRSPTPCRSRRHAG